MPKHKQDLLLLWLLAAARVEADHHVERHEARERDWYLNGDGRSPRYVDTEHGRVNVGGKGHRYPTCIHGRNVCVDYDIPCGTCESGDTMRELFMAEVYENYRVHVKRRDMVKAITELGYGEGQHPDTVKPLSEWAWQPISYDFDQAMAQRHERSVRKEGWMRMVRSTDTPAPMPPSFEDREAQAHYDDTWRS